MKGKESGLRSIGDPSPVRNFLLSPGGVSGEIERPNPVCSGNLEESNPHLGLWDEDGSVESEVTSAAAGTKILD